MNERRQGFPKRAKHSGGVHEKQRSKHFGIVILIDGETLAQYMVDNNVGVSIESVYEVKKIDSDYFEDN